MPTGNARLIREFLAAATRRDLPAVAALCTPDVRFRAIVSGGERVYRGEEGLARWLEEIEEAFPGSYALAERVEDLGDAVIATGSTRGREFSFDWWVTFHLEGGRIASWEFHPSREHAERALQRAAR